MFRLYLRELTLLLSPSPFGSVCQSPNPPSVSPPVRQSLIHHTYHLSSHPPKYWYPWTIQQLVTGLTELLRPTSYCRPCQPPRARRAKMLGFEESRLRPALQNRRLCADD